MLIVFLMTKATKGANWAHTRQNAVKQTSDNFDDDYDNDYNKDDDDENSDGKYDEDDLRSKVGMQGMMHPRRQQMIPGFSKPWDEQVSEQSGKCTEHKKPNVKKTTIRRIFHLGILVNQAAGTPTSKATWVKT